MKMKHKILFGVTYTIVYAFLAIASINPEGTGTGIFFAPLITWLFLFVSLYLSSRLEDSRNRVFFIVFMIAHYVTSLFFIAAFWNDSYNGKLRVMRMWEREPNLILFILAWYLSGQLIIWIVFFKRVKRVAKVRK
jgi:hypothetical protein